MVGSARGLRAKLFVLLRRRRHRILDLCAGRVDAAGMAAASQAKRRAGDDIEVVATVGSGDEAAATARAYAGQKTWTREQVAAANPRWPERDLVAKLSALEHWDAGTAGWRLAMGPVEFTPTVPPSVPSLVLLADPSTLVPPDRAQRLRELGWEVRTVPGAGHSIHRDDFDGFFTALEGWL